MIAAFGSMLDSLLQVFIKILLPVGGLTPLSVVMWFGIILACLGATSAWVMGLTKGGRAQGGRAVGAAGGGYEHFDFDRDDVQRNGSEIDMFNKAQRGEITWGEYLSFSREFHKDDDESF